MTIEMRLSSALIFLSSLITGTLATPYVFKNELYDYDAVEYHTTLQQSLAKGAVSFRPFDSRTRELLSFHRLLVETQSITGDEFAVGTALALYLKSPHHGVGYTVETQKVEDKRFNVLAYFGEERDADILVTSHIDTVCPLAQSLACVEIRKTTRNVHTIHFKQRYTLPDSIYASHN